MKDSEIIKCPKCGSREIGEGKQKGYAGMVPAKGALSRAIRYRICTQCGYIIEGYVSTPKKFK